VDAWMRSREDKTVFAIAFRKVSSTRLLEMASCLFEDALEI